MSDFEKKIRQQLDDNMQQVSPDIARRLQQARYAALEKMEQQPGAFVFSRIAMATTALSVLVLVVSLFLQQSVLQPEIEVAMEEELELLTANDSLELLEDIEFMQWLAETENAG